LTAHSDRGILSLIALDAQFVRFLLSVVVGERMGVHADCFGAAMVNRRKTLSAGGRGFGRKAARVPADPEEVLALAGGPPRHLPGHRLLRWRASLLRARLRRADLTCNDHGFDLAWTGPVTKGRILRLILHLRESLSELFSHPATVADGASPPGFRPIQEHRAPTGPRLSDRIAEREIRLVGFGDTPAPHP